ncbi:peptidylprolyl isomerase [Candidatus Kaiserbacteria bacterium CG10_big_fil_rev_8_21_14_0_10_56_12]|uniref:Peptidyl-prolyl cis-trans isomerase n=1 Tax=Candidatus Kaiserbacteria bacterium CG10_big_fil_rev_8_21_14_0_10_56_12 TaxID=1974611 RepID=A0A2H0U973_9BACT|nr:MAG: peptidylprolyl isomerase [Candidatus Kaiserbacteria bacterium CG10_big_fil_rev_8_21_14_0_10_56_12]
MKPIQTGIAVALALIVVLIFFVFPGLSPFGDISQPQTEGDISQNATTTMSNDSSEQLQSVDTIVGTGEQAAVGDTVTVNYVGSLTDGTVFDASASHGSDGFTFLLGEGKVIKGWDEGVAGMKVGGKRHLVIPAALAYGDQEVGGVIPANSTLVFDIELLNVQKGGQ